MADAFAVNEDVKLRHEINRGNQASILLENELFHEAIESLESEIIDKWKTSPLRDVEGRESLRLLMEVTNKFKAYLMTTLETGRLASIQLQQKQTLKERAAQWIGME